MAGTGGGKWSPTEPFDIQVVKAALPVLPVKS